jgi:hypothetical protein
MPLIYLVNDGETEHVVTEDEWLRIGAEQGWTAFSGPEYSGRRLAAKNCAHCLQHVIPCDIDRCPGWNTQGCSGWMHTDLFHGCPGGQHCAAPATTATGTKRPTEG